MKLRVLLVVLVYFIAANVPLWLASHLLGLSLHGYFNVEFLVIGILSVFLRRTITISLLSAVIALDLLNWVGNTYLFGFSDLFLSASSLSAYAPSHFWSLAAVAACIGCAGAAANAAFHTRPGGKERWCVVSALTTIAVLCIAADGARGQIRMFGFDCTQGEVRLTRNSLRPLAISAMQEWNFMHSAYAPEPMTGALAKLAAFDPIGEDKLTRADSVLPNVVFVLVESWGKPLSRDVDEALASPYMSSAVAERYTVSRGTVPFRGPTVNGEMRELCESTLGFGVFTTSDAQLKHCLPAKFAGMGYRTVSVHGFAARMFSRNEWYPKVGFDERWFREDLEKVGLPQCQGPFPGICDASVAGWIGDRLVADSDKPQFVYWLTLNSHLPVPVTNGVKDPPSCTEIGGLAQDRAGCSWFQLIFNVHRSVAELAARTSGRPTAFVIVGDHAPPFAASKLREQFSDVVVPYVILWPTDGQGNFDSAPARSIAQTTPQSDQTRRAALRKTKTPAGGA